MPQTLRAAQRDVEMGPSLETEPIIRGSLAGAEWVAKQDT